MFGRITFDPQTLGGRAWIRDRRTPMSVIGVASARAGNVIGGGDWAKDRIIPDCVRALLKGEAIKVRNPCATRPWQHVLEPLSGYLTLAARMLTSDDPTLCEAWNFGPLSSDELPVAELVEVFLKAWGDGSWEHVDQTAALKEAAVLRVAIDKAAARLGWRPRWSVAEAVGITAAWYRDQVTQRGEMSGRCLEDIRHYIGIAPDFSRSKRLPLFMSRCFKRD